MFTSKFLISHNNLSVSPRTSTISVAYVKTCMTVLETLAMVYPEQLARGLIFGLQLLQVQNYLWLTCVYMPKVTVMYKLFRSQPESISIFSSGHLTMICYHQEWIHDKTSQTTKYRHICRPIKLHNLSSQG